MSLVRPSLLELMPFRLTWLAENRVNQRPLKAGRLKPPPDACEAVVASGEACPGAPAFETTAASLVLCARAERLPKHAHAVPATIASAKFFKSSGLFVEIISAPFPAMVEQVSCQWK
jgi:hypothetical protein